MQDIHPIISSGGGDSGGGRVLLRRHSHNNPHQQALKCPRCDSMNTKFCYYNNYNLSQPRHFCKCCRRYWTNGGVLRNVPVGGGCRKSKRSNSSSKPKSSKTSTPNNSHSSSDSSSAATAAAGGVVGSSDGGGLFRVSEADVLLSGDIGGFVNLLSTNHNHSSSPSSSAASGAVETASFSQLQEWDMGKMGGILDPTVGIDDLLQNRGSVPGLPTLDWHQAFENVQQGLFDFPNSTLDHQAYWTQTQTTTFSNNNNNNHHQQHTAQWSDDNATDHTLFFP